ncbi:energy transducer TonB [Lunatibacter salilacus]|uniref:energy transducer TonB n=1 Tax=Lunatibacter salilacus TaxID=2483804 RepID=UPI00131E9DF5|nr:energy transducer TonB [Lunatibacter salilacus]
MKLILNIRLLMVAFCWLVLSTTSLAQEKKIIPLNEHFFPLETEGENQQYSKIVSISPEGELVEKIYSLEYSLVSITKSIYEEGQPREPLWEEKQQFLPDGELEFTQLKYRKANSRHTKVVAGEELILDLECKGSSKCDGIFVSTSGYQEDVDRDILKPSFPTIEVWQKFLTKNLTYPPAARNANEEAEVWVGMKISEFGEILERAVVNGSISHPSLIKEVERILELYKGDVVPARDIEGDYITAWMYFPVRFILN